MKNQVRIWFKQGQVANVDIPIADENDLGSAMLSAKANGYYNTGTAFIPYDNIAFAVLEPLGTKLDVPNTQRMPLPPFGEPGPSGPPTKMPN